MAEVQKKRIFICEDHTIVIDGLKALLQFDTRFEIIGHNDEDGFHKKVSGLTIDLLLLDLNLNGIDGFQLLKEFREYNLTTKIIILTMYKENELIERAKKLGANAYILKNTSNHELIDCFNKVYEHDFYLGNTLSSHLNGHDLFKDRFTHKVKLTKREIEIIKLISSGKSSQVIAEELFLSPLTIETHKKNIFKKLQVNSSVELVTFAHENNLV